MRCLLALLLLRQHRRRTGSTDSCAWNRGLMRIEGSGFGASERLQPVTEARLVGTIVTAAEIARHGYRTLATSCLDTGV